MTFLGRRFLEKGRRSGSWFDVHRSILNYHIRTPRQLLTKNLARLSVVCGVVCVVVGVQQQVTGVVMGVGDGGPQKAKTCDSDSPGATRRGRKQQEGTKMGGRARIQDIKKPRVSTRTHTHKGLLAAPRTGNCVKSPGWGLLFWSNSAPPQPRSRLALVLWLLQRLALCASWGCVAPRIGGSRAFCSQFRAALYLLGQLMSAYTAAKHAQHGVKFACPRPQSTEPPSMPVHSPQSTVHSRCASRALPVAGATNMAAASAATAAISLRLSVNTTGSSPRPSIPVHQPAPHWSTFLATLSRRLHHGDSGMGTLLFHRLFHRLVHRGAPSATPHSSFLRPDRGCLAWHPVAAAFHCELPHALGSQGYPLAQGDCTTNSV